jgi:ubiquinone/menaquinone biosynthesis C-methylase UbiE
MMKNAEKTLSKFYEKFGWKVENEITEDARQFEDLRECAIEYLNKSRLRVFKHIPSQGQFILDMASGPIQYPEYLSYSKNFEKRYCVDLSKDALSLAEKKIGDHGIYLNGSFFDIPLSDNYFDCSISLHTIYHMDKDKQSTAVNKLLDVTKPGKPVIIVYSNPNTLLGKLSKYRNRMKNISNSDESFYSVTQEQEIYFYLHNLEWWNQFRNRSSVKIYPWRSFLTETQNKYFPDNSLGKILFKVLYRLEDFFPNFFARNFQYIIVVLTKK